MTLLRPPALPRVADALASPKTLGLSAYTIGTLLLIEKGGRVVVNKSRRNGRNRDAFL